MKTIFPFKFHPLFFFTALICALTGLFRNFCILTILIIVHEMGHILASFLFHWPIEKVVIFPFGGMTFFKTDVNRSLKEEFCILLAGPITQILFFLTFKPIFLSPLWVRYHYALLIFNLLPIYPLDGGKLLLNVSHYFFSFQRTYRLIYGVSLVLTSIFLFWYRDSLFSFLVFLFLLKDLILACREQKYLFSKFLLERFLYTYPFKKTKKINGIHVEKMQKEKYHLFQTEKNLYFEKEILAKMFDRKR